MQKAIIYCQLDPDRTLEKEVERIKAFITKIDADMLGVFIDPHDNNDELMNMTKLDLSVISFLYINKPLVDEFAHKLLQELSRQDKFKIHYFHELSDL